MKTKFILILLLAASIFPIEASSNDVKKVAIMQIIDNENKVEYGVKLMLRSYLGLAITNTPGYIGLERVDVSAIMDEQDFQRTGMVNENQIKQLGEMTGADYILLAEAAMLDANNIFLTAKIINIESAQIESTANIQSLITNQELENNCRTLSEKLFMVDMETGSVNSELMIGEDRYVGEHKNGLPHGQGTIYYAENDIEGRKSYQGNWINGNKIGKGTFCWTNGDKYEGDLKDEVPNGSGTYYWANGERYEGDWVDGKRHGKGTLYYPKEDKLIRKSYQGDWVNNSKHGKGIICWTNGNRYEGDFVKDKVNGNGTYYYANGDRYEGDWLDGTRHGKGNYYWSDGSRYEGYWINDKKQGKGNIYWPDGSKYEGNWLEDQKHGKGTYYDSNGNYEKQKYKNGKLHGNVFIYVAGIKIPIAAVRYINGAKVYDSREQKEKSHNNGISFSF
ncbi:MAG: hypothetical protein IJ442_02895 [Bacteroidaceae bacterium]|nr:hypothetical protein [Bacteroidaceae bacterium]